MRRGQDLVREIAITLREHEWDVMEAVWFNPRPKLDSKSQQETLAILCDADVVYRDRHGLYFFTDFGQEVWRYVE